MKENFYLNFCRRHQHRDGYVRILASSYDSAFRAAVAKFHMDWQQIAEEAKFNKARFPKGEVIFMEAS